MTLGPGVQIADADDIIFTRTVMSRLFRLSDDVSSYNTGFVDGSTAGFVQGITQGLGAGRNAGADSIEKPEPYDSGFRVGVASGASGLSAAFARGLAQGSVSGAIRGLAIGQQRGIDSVNVPEPFDAGFRVGLSAATAASAGSIDVTPPSVAVLSPTPGVAPGSPGGFPAAFSAARVTPIVLRFSDAGGVVAAIVTATYRDYPRRGQQITEVVYNRGSFVSNYIKLSSQTLVSGVVTLTCGRDDGWPVGTGMSGDIVFGLEVVDTSGNVT